AGGQADDRLYRVGHRVESSHAQKWKADPGLARGAPAVISSVMDAPIDQLLAYKGVTVALWFALLFAAERAAPAAATARGWFGDWPRLAGNAGLWVINSLLSLAVVVPVSAWAAG